MRLSVYFTPVNYHLIGNVHWVQIFKSKSNFPRVRIILNAEIEFFNNDCYTIIHYILLLLHSIELFRPGVNTIIICDFAREHESFATRSVPYNKDKSVIQKYIISTTTRRLDYTTLTLPPFSGSCLLFLYFPTVFTASGNWN